MIWWRLKVVPKLEMYPSLHMLDSCNVRKQCIPVTLYEFPFYTTKRKPWLHETSSHPCNTLSISFCPELSAPQNSSDRSFVVGQSPKVACYLSGSRACPAFIPQLHFLLWLFPAPHRGEQSLHRAGNGHAFSKQKVKQRIKVGDIPLTLSSFLKEVLQPLMLP